MSKVYEAHGYSQIPYEQGYIKTPSILAVQEL